MITPAGGEEERYSSAVKKIGNAHVFEASVSATPSSGA